MADDQLQRFLFDRASVRGEWVSLGSTWRDALAHHDYPLVVRQRIGELMGAAALLSAIIKFEGRMSLQIQGSGPVRMMLAEANHKNELRAMAKWKGDLSSAELKDIFGAKASLVITIELDKGSERYQGVVSLVGGTIASAIEEYLQQSEQLKSRIWLVAGEKRVSGIMLQRIPGDRRDEHELAWQRINALASTLTESELLELDSRTLLHRLFHEESVLLFDPQEISFSCHCSRERVTTMLKALGRQEVDAVLEQEGEVEIKCEFCMQPYSFDAIDIHQLFSDVPKPPVSGRSQ